MNKSKIYEVPDEEFKELIASSFTYSDCLRKFGLCTDGGSSRDALKRRIKELGCSTEHFNPYINNNGEKHKLPLDKILVENSTYSNTSGLKERLLSEGLIEYKCEKCGISEWQGAPISLHLDHKNGVNNDHRLSNLRLLCPNCHSQTDTYAGKNTKELRQKATEKLNATKEHFYCKICGKEIYMGSSYCKEHYVRPTKITWPDRKALKKKIRTTPFVKIAKELGVSDKAIVKRCKKYGLPSKTSEIKKISDEDWINI